MIGKHLTGSSFLTKCKKKSLFINKIYVDVVISTYTIWWGQHKQTPCLSSTASFDSSLHLAYLQMPSDSGGNSAAVLTASHLEAFLYLRKSEVSKPVRVQSELTCCPFHRQLMADNDLTYGVWVWIPLWHHRFVVIGWFSSVKKKKKNLLHIHKANLWSCPSLSVHTSVH